MRSKIRGHCHCLTAFCLGHSFLFKPDRDWVLTEPDLKSTGSLFFMHERDSSPAQLKPFPHQRSATRRVETCNYICLSAKTKQNKKKTDSFTPMRLKEIVYYQTNLKCYGYRVVTSTYSLLSCNSRRYTSNTRPLLNVSCPLLTANRTSCSFHPGRKPLPSHGPVNSTIRMHQHLVLEVWPN